MRLLERLKRITASAILKLIIGGALIVIMSLPSASASFANSTKHSHLSADAHAGSSYPPAHFASASFLPILGDFDGDRRLDEAQQHSLGAHYCIRVRFGDWRESHLDFGTHPHYTGTLLALDVNHDNKPDLIWLYRARSEPAVVWPNDGRGHFGKATELKLDAELRGKLLSDSDRGVLTSGPDYERFCLTPDPVRSDAVDTARFDGLRLKPVDLLGLRPFRDLDLCLSFLRERGPPQHTSAV